MDITNILETIEETDYSRVDRCVVYSDIILFLQGFKNNFGVADTGSKLKNAVADIIIKSIKDECDKNIETVKKFINLNLIR